ncbi:hypothetical protein Thiowin_01043 [Thiorhodovibrio winogradskyi]|uniref:Uncharacterized protein n=1 Tax=Thiorhodovibrio winogradskyi TaxID=77007 RepID=A0ABZ0S668_9GAMM
MSSHRPSEAQPEPGLTERARMPETLIQPHSRSLGAGFLARGSAHEALFAT